MITASILYDHLSCPHRVAMDAFGDPSRKDAISSFVQMLWERGSLFEQQTMQRLGVPFADLSGYAGEEKEAQTRAAIKRGEPLLYSGRLSVGELLGEPDLLRKEGFGYAAIDIKSGAGEEGGDDDEEGKPNKKYGVQLALYTDILERLGVSAGRYGYIWDIHGDEVRYELDALRGPKSPSINQIYIDAKTAVQRTLNREQPTLPAAAAVCKLCVWRSACLAGLKNAGDLTLLPGLGRSKRDVLCVAFPTVETLANSDVSPFVQGKKTAFAGVGPDMLKKLQARAKLAIAKNPVPYFREAVALPHQSTEVFFDIEDDPMRDLVYLHGFVVRKDGNSDQEKFFAIYAAEPTGQSEHDAFAAAWEFLMQHRESMVYHYSKHERTQYRKLQKKYPNVCTAEEVEALFSPGRSFDLYYDAVCKAEWPTLNWSIKSLAKFLGFKWRDVDPSGAASIEWFDQWVRTGSPGTKQRILDYNEDDCRAARVLLDGLRALGSGE